MTRALVVYSVDDPQGGTTYPTLREAVKDARSRREHYGEDASMIAYLTVSKVTIPGPFNRELVCRLLSHGAYASSIEVVWPTPK